MLYYSKHVSSSEAGIVVLSVARGTLKIHPVLYYSKHVNSSGRHRCSKCCTRTLKIHPVLYYSKHVSSCEAGIVVLSVARGTLKIHPVLYYSKHVNSSGRHRYSKCCTGKFKDTPCVILQQARQ